MGDSSVKSNLRQAFTATDSESIARVIDYVDFSSNRAKLDQLTIMTFLYQLRNHFEAALNKEINNNNYNNNENNSKIKNSTSNPKSVGKTMNNSASSDSTSLAESNSSGKIKKTGGYSNPFESDNDEEEKRPGEIKMGDVHKASINEVIKTSSLLEIKSNGQIVDANCATSSDTLKLNAVANQASRKAVAPKFAPTSALRPVESSSDEIIQKAKDLIEKNKMPTKQSVSWEFFFLLKKINRWEKKKFQLYFFVYFFGLVRDFI